MKSAQGGLELTVMVLLRGCLVITLCHPLTNEPRKFPSVYISQRAISALDNNIELTVMVVL